MILPKSRHLVYLEHFLNNILPPLKVLANLKITYLNCYGKEDATKGKS